MEKQKAAVVKTPKNVCVVSLGIVGADKMDKMTTYLKVVFIVNFSYLKRSVFTVIVFAVAPGSGSNNLTVALIQRGLEEELQRGRDQERNCF